MSVGCKEEELTDFIVEAETTPPNCSNQNEFNANVIIDDLNWLPHDQNFDVSQSTNASSVGHLKIPKVYASCTAFLINRNTIMTNNHCISTNAQAVGALFKPLRDDNTRDSYLCEKLLVTNYMLDFSLIQCTGNPGDKYGHIPLSQRKIEEDDSIYVVQENCNYLDNPRCIIDKYFAFGITTQSVSNKISHDADTLPGSSGSPIFAEDTDELIGLHNAGKGDTSYSDASNYAIPIKQIRQYLVTNYPEIPFSDFDGAQAPSPLPLPNPGPLPTPKPDLDECLAN